MPEGAFVFRGSVFDEVTDRAAIGIEVIVVDDPVGAPAVMLSGATDSAGIFQIAFGLAELVQLFRGSDDGTAVERRQPVLHAFAMRDGVIAARASATVTLAHLSAGTPMVALRMPATARGTGCEYLVRGSLVEADARPRAGVTIEVVSRRLRGESVIATTVTDANGAFSASYRTNEPCDPARPGLTLLVRARVTGGPVLASSPSVCDAPAELVVTLVVGDVPLRGPARVTDLEDALRDRLDGIPLSELTADEVERLACATRRSALDVARLSRATALAERTGIARHVFFALADSGVPMTLAAVCGLSDSEILRALERAGADDVVPPWGPDEPAAIVASIRAVALDLTYAIDRPRESLLGRLFEHAGVSAALPRDFVVAYVARTGTVREFWAQFRRTHGDAAVETVQFTLGAASLVGNHVPLVAALQAERVGGARPALARAARRNAAEWARLLRDRSSGPPIGAPTGLPGSTDDQRIALYSTTLERSFEHAFPTEVTAHVLATAGGDAQVAAFVELNPDFDLGTTHVDTFLAARPPLPPGPSTELARSLLLAQRLHAVLPTLGRREPLAAMIAAGFTSAAAIHRLGVGALARRLPGVGTEMVARIHQRAGQLAAKAMTTFFKLGGPAQSALPAVMTYIMPTGLPNVAGLLGRMDFCACTSCRSVFSPAAYLTDLLRFCDDQGVLGALVARRPDLVTVRLGCDNTNTLMSTIDLAIEVLEDVVAPPAIPHQCQTHWSAPELRAHPEHVNGAAYAELRGASYPWLLPFDLSRVEARAYLEYLGVPLVEALEAVRGHDPASRHDIALERLGLGPTQGELIDGTFAFATPGASWGMAQANWVGALGDSVRLAMNHSSLGYDDFLQLARTTFVGGFTITFAEDAPCELDSASFRDLTEWRLLRIPRFERLRAALGLPIAELDATIRALRSPGANPLDAGCLDRIATHVRLRQRFPSVPERTRLAWWGRIDTRRGRHGEPSYYDTLFLDRTLAPDNAAFAIGDGATELTHVVPIADVHRTVLQAAFSISEAELTAVLASGSPAAPLVDLDLHTLSRLLRRVTLARALGLRLIDLLALAELSGMSPFADDVATAAPDPEVTARFVAMADTLRDVGLRVAEVDYLLRARTGDGLELVLSDAAIAVRIVALIRGLQQVRRENTQATDGARSDLDQLVGALPRVVDAELVDAVLAFVRTVPPGPAAPAVLEQLARFLPAGAVDALGAAIDPRGEDERIADVLALLLEHLRRVASEDLVVQAFADATALAPATALVLLRATVVAGLPALVLLRDDAFVDAVDFERDGAAIAAEGFPPATWPNVAAQATVMRRIHAAARAIGALSLGTAQVQALVERGTPRGWFDLLAFPAAPVVGPSPTFTAFLDLCGVALECRRSFADRSAGFVAIVDAPDGPVAPATLEALAAAAAWSRDELAVVATSMLALSGQDLRSGARLAQLTLVFRVLARLGVGASRLLAWASSEPDAAIAQAIKNTARAQVAPEEWPGIAGPLRDGLRRRQRDALVARALTELGLHDRDALSERLLIDVAGEPCQRTSRIRQAIATVQTFVQRVTLSLEGGLALPLDAVQQWSWLSRYRVWEANRRVFLYPENYLDPALRRDASPQFRELSDEVAGSDGDPTRIETAYRHYLAGLDDLGHLSICGVYHQREVTGGHVYVDDLHVIGRSDGHPNRFYYRRRVGGTTWSPWEEISGRIEGRDATPVVWNGRLLLLWLALREVATDFTPAKDRDPAPPTKLLEARLGWMERRHGEWTRPTLSEVTMILPPRPGQEPTKNEWFSASSPEDVGFDVRLGSTAVKVTPIVHTTIHFKWLTDVARAYVVDDSFALYGDGKVAIVHDQFRIDYARLGPRPSTPKHQAFQIAAGHDVRLPLADPHYPGSVRLTEPILATEHTSEIVATRISVGPPSAKWMTEEPFFFQDLRRIHLVEPRNVYTAGSGAAIGDEMTIEQRQEVDLGAFVPTQTLALALASAPPPSPAAAVMGLSLTAGLDAQPIATALPTWIAKGFDVACFYHPFSRWLIAMLEERGIDGFFAPPEDGRWSQFHRQRIHHSVFDDQHYHPGPHVDASGTVEQLDFDPWTPLSLYNWELFFHGPMMVAGQLAAAGRYDEARRWIHAVFDPHDASSEPAPSRYWRLKPFFEASTPTNIADDLETLSYAGGDAARIKRRKALELQIERWRANPFEPHLIAQLRPAAYQRWTVMRYLDVLIAWGDALFRQDTLESTNEALQLYMMAARLLGPRPEQIERDQADERNYSELAAVLDDFSNAIVELENAIPGWKATAFDLTPSFALAEVHSGSPSGQAAFVVPLQDDAHATELAIAGPPTLPQPSAGPVFGGSFVTTDPPTPTAPPSLYFCVPPNEKMLAYWDTVADRLFKLRNCLSIDGVRRELALFEPPIDPMLLVRARAQGIDIASAVNALAAPLPHHRFRTMIAMAKELCADVRALGQSIGQAFERRDAETLAELRAGQERDVLRAVRAVREQQLEEARANREGLVAAQAIARGRLHFVTTRVRRLPEEDRQSELIGASKSDTRTSIAFEDTASALGVLPNFTIGFSGVASPVGTTTLGGATFAAIFGAVARHYAASGQLKQSDASIAGMKAGLQRRDEEWDQEALLAQLEIDRVDRELAAVDIRIAIAQKELDTHELQIRNAEDVDDFLRSRFSNAELYGQMASELGRVYFAAYQLAFDLAKRAERTYQYELAAPEASFVEFGYWDNTRRGLLAGDKLMHDLRRMEVAYAQHDRRELELVKNVSLALLDPMALVLLRETGECSFDVPEALFDLDHPGHYLRRIRSLSVTLPLVEGAHGNVTGTLVLVHSTIRRVPTLTDAPVDDPTADLQQIGLSTGIDDAGVLDRGGDDRRMPFEGRGAVSRWRLSLPTPLRQFDYRDISDVVLRIAYTARDGGEVLRTAVIDGLEQALLSAQQTLGIGLVRRLSLATHFPEAWSAFSAASGVERVLEVEIADVHFPMRLRAGLIRMRRVWLIATFARESSALGLDLMMPRDGGDEIGASVTLGTVHTPSVRSGVALAPAGEAPPVATTGRWRISIATDALPEPDALVDLALLVEYVAAP